MKRFAIALMMLAATPALAQADAEELTRAVEERNQLAMEDHDLGEHEAARDALMKSLDALGKAGLAESRAAARTHLLLGVVHGAGFGDRDRAFEHYAVALVIDRRVELDERFASEEQASIFRQAVESLEARPPRPVDCERLVGLAHHAGGPPRWSEPHEIAAYAASDLREGKVILAYAVDGGRLREIQMKPGRGCALSATVPAGAVRGDALSYYFVVRDDAGEVLARRGDAEDRYQVPIQAPPEPKSEPAGKPDEPRACSRCQAGGGSPLGTLVFFAALFCAWRAPITRGRRSGDSPSAGSSRRPTPSRSRRRRRSPGPGA